MRVVPTPLAGAAVVELDLIEDARGFFARSFCRGEFLAAGLDPVIEQTNVAFNHRAGTLRGLHYQIEPQTEAKLVRCYRGAILDVIVDLMPDSPTFLRHVAVALSADNLRALYVPHHFAHGYLTLTDRTEVLYHHSSAYAPGLERGLRHDDPALGIQWPGAVTTISEKDAAWPLLSEAPITRR